MLPSLSSACTICHRSPKYTCPRCTARTCSVPCVKAHKARSLCSGERNPGDYIRRSDLATPSAFDRDFNFLAGLERQIERAERDVESKGLTTSLKRPMRDQDNELDAMKVRKVGEKVVEGMRAWRMDREAKNLAKGEFNVMRVLDESDIRVRRAPMGLERRSRNRTNWHLKTRSINWTVEWMSEGRREYGTALDTKPMSEIWQHHMNRSEVFAGKAPRAASKSSGKATELPQPESTDEHSTRTESKVDDISFLLHVPGESQGNRRAVICVDSSKSLRQALKGSEVLEFPRIEVTNHRPYQLDPNLYSVYSHRLDVGTQERKLNLAASSTGHYEASEHDVPCIVNRSEAGCH